MCDSSTLLRSPRRHRWQAACVSDVIITIAHHASRSVSLAFMAATSQCSSAGRGASCGRCASSVHAVLAAGRAVDFSSRRLLLRLGGRLFLCGCPAALGSLSTARDARGRGCDCQSPSNPSACRCCRVFHSSCPTLALVRVGNALPVALAARLHLRWLPRRLWCLRLKGRRLWAASSPLPWSSLRVHRRLCGTHLCARVRCAGSVVSAACSTAAVSPASLSTSFGEPVRRGLVRRSAISHPWVCLLAALSVCRLAAVQ